MYFRAEAHIKIRNTKDMREIHSNVRDNTSVKYSTELCVPRKHCAMTLIKSYYVVISFVFLPIIPIKYRIRI